MKHAEHAPTLAIGGVDTAGNGPSKVRQVTKEIRCNRGRRGALRGRASRRGRWLGRRAQLHLPKNNLSLSEAGSLSNIFWNFFVEQRACGGAPSSRIDWKRLIQALMLKMRGSVVSTRNALEKYSKKQSIKCATAYRGTEAELGPRL